MKTDLELMQALLRHLGEDSTREGLKETPERFLRSLEFLCSGYGKDPSHVMKAFEDGSENYNQMIQQGPISFHSLCEHHLAPFFGYIYIGYIPNGKVVGLSKLSRVAEIFARRLQVQERMTQQIASAIQGTLEPRGVIVVVEARHMCMESRGVQKQGVSTRTTALSGLFEDDPSTKSEFMSYLASARVAP